MGKHYIPQFYLKGFTEKPVSPFIWTYWKGTGREFHPHIKHIAQENDYFSDETERFLAQKIEGPTASVIEKIIKNKAISKKDKKTLSDFMSVLIKSCPHGRKKAINSFIENYDNFFMNFISQLKAGIKKDPTHRDLLEKRIEEIRAIQNNNREQIKDGVLATAAWESILSPIDESVISDVINDMTWLFLIFRKPVFLTSDNPIFWFESMGVGKPNSEISFPVSPQIALWATWRSDFNDGYMFLQARFVHEINRRTIDFAQKFVFSSLSEEWIPRAIRTTRHRLNLINPIVNYSEIFYGLP